LNNKEYISTGVIEAYVLGDLSKEERTTFEKELAQSPELREELRKTEQVVEALLMKGAVWPAEKVKEKIFSSIVNTSNRQLKSDTKTVPIYWKWVAAASILLAVISVYVAVDYQQKWLKTTIALNNLIDQNRQIAEKYTGVNQKLSKIEQDFSIIENSSFTKVVMKGTVSSPTSIASVYWSADTQEVYLSIQNLKQIVSNQHYQLWAISDGVPVDMGVFDSNFSGLLKMKNVSQAQAFAVTIEPRGGKPTPTLENMQVLGYVLKS
jgi:anti-sigma-K factor RskA